MSILKSLDLTPAESLMLLGEGWSRSEWMLTATFADLLMKRVLEAQPMQLRQGDRSFEIYVRPGENYRYLDRLKPHEIALARCVPPGNKPVWMHLYSVAEKFRRKEVGIVWYFKLGFVRCPMLKNGYFRKEDKGIFSLVLYYSYPPTEKGLEARARIEELVNDCIINMERWVKEEPARAQALIDLCGTNMLLIQNYYDLKTIVEWSRSISNEMPGIESRTSSYYDYHWYDYGWRESTQDGCSSVTSQDPPRSFKPGFSSLDFGFLDAFNSFKAFEKAFKKGWQGPLDNNSYPYG